MELQREQTQHCHGKVPLPKLDTLRKMGFTAVSQTMPLYWNAASTACCHIFNRLWPCTVQLVQMQPSPAGSQPCSAHRPGGWHTRDLPHPHDKDRHHPRAQVTLTSQRSQCCPVTPVLQKHWPVCGWQESVPQGEQLHSAREKYTQYYTEEPISHSQHLLLTGKPLSPLSIKVKTEPLSTWICLSQQPIPMTP